MMGLIVKILWKIYKTPLILLHAARHKTWLTGVRPAVELSWKALTYADFLKIFFLKKYEFLS